MLLLGLMSWDHHRANRQQRTAMLGTSKCKLTEHEIVDRAAVPARVQML